MAPFTVMVHGAALQVGTPDPAGPTAIEHALIEHVCRTTGPPGAAGIEVYQECYNAQLLSLRADFGRDLSRLSAAERRTLDSVCGQIREANGREAYLGCLNGQLTSLRSRRRRGNPVPAVKTAVPSPSVSDPAPASVLPAPQASSRSTALWIGTALATVVLAAGGVLLAARTRRASRKCHVCGADVRHSGDLCPTCRHEAAESLRRAAAERADQQRAEEEKQRRQSEQEEQRRQRQEEEAGLRQQEEARQQQEKVRQRQLEDTRQWSPSTDVSEETFDPYAVLGVPREASKEHIAVAYQEAKLKYDPDQLAYLSTELQEHFKAKAQAVERAYQMLTE